MLLLTRHWPLSQVVNSLYRHHGFPSFENQYQITPLFTVNYGRHPASSASLFSKSAIASDLQVHFFCFLSESGVERPRLLGDSNGSLLGSLRGVSSMTDQLWPHHQALCQRSSQRPLIESQCHRWHYWLDRLALGWRGLEWLARCSLTTWPTQNDSLPFQNRVAVW